jgi:predicted ATP-grasp superfamily ATP-dependent carboligase
MIDSRPETTATSASDAEHPRSLERLPPAIVLDGRVNALSIARSLARIGVAVHALGDSDSPARHSRYLHWVRFPQTDEPAAQWTEFLLGPQSEFLRGAVLIAAGDAGLEVIMAHRAALAERFLLDDVNPQAQQCMLNKLSTYRAAVEAGVPTPRFWLARSVESVADLRDELVYPLLVKPTLSHVFERQFDVKHLTVENFDELIATLRSVGDTESEIMLVEKIPGLDDRLCSYYTYLDADLNPQFDLTKRVIRRYPVGQGNACYHITDRNPEVREMALRLLRHVGLRGLANVEFKRDDRDGRLKLIECNARFTAPDCLISRSGFNLPRFVYKRIAGLPREPLANYRAGVRLWYPVEDYLAYRELRRRGEMTRWQWLTSIAHHQTFPMFQFRDPLPTFVTEWRRFKRIAGRIKCKLLRTTTEPHDEPPMRS